ncbi:MAG: hypothetical protein R3B13_05035 [Polyangiaceae bacterium]
MRKAVSAGVALLVGGACFPSCAERPAVKVVLKDPCVDINTTSFKDSGAYTEFVVFRNGCPTDEDLKAGKTSGAVFRKVVPSDGKLPDVGDLDKVKYGFAALVRNESCGVVGFGCTAADMEDVREVRIAVCDWSAQTDDGAPTCGCKLLSGPGCESPKICNKGSCSETGECVVDDTDVTGCPLTVAASGPLPAPSDSAGVISGPGLVVTPDGFVVAYREMSTAGDAGAVRLIRLSDCGGPGVAFNLDLAKNSLTCSGGTLSDGLGLAYSGDIGVAAASLPNCGGGAGVLLMDFDSLGAPVTVPSAPRNSAFEKFTLASPTGALAPGSGPSKFDLVFRVQQGPTSSDVERVMVVASGGGTPAIDQGVPVSNPLGPEDVPFGKVATSSQLRAFVGLVPSKSPTGMVLSLGPNAADTLEPKGEVTLPDANWAVVTAWNDKAAALVPTASGATWKAAQLAGSTVSEVATGTVGSGSLKGAAMTTLRDHLLVATSTSQGISVHRIAGADGTLSTSAADSVALASDLGGGVLDGFDGERLAIAAGRTRVAVVWVNKSQYSTGDVVGGWALLKCVE